MTLREAGDYEKLHTSEEEQARDDAGGRMTRDEGDHQTSLPPTEMQPCLMEEDNTNGRTESEVHAAKATTKQQQARDKDQETQGIEDQEREPRSG